MDMKTYELLVKNSVTAMKYVSKKTQKNRHHFCPFCCSRKFWKLGDGRRRCQRCHKAFHDLTGRWWNKVNLPMDVWLRIVKLFELELSARKIAIQTGLAYNTVHKALMTLRHSILAHANDGERIILSGEIELDESYFGGRRKGNRGRGAEGKIPVFGILSRKGRVSVSMVPDVKGATLLDLTVKMVRRGSIVYTDKYKAYDSLMFCGYRHLSVDHSSKFSDGKVHINGLEGFWSWAKERLLKHHGISPQWFPLYLKELEFRYNHRHDPDLFERLVDYMSDLIPTYDYGEEDQ
jgi:transposase